jgi:hypothetical protein
MEFLYTADVSASGADLKERVTIGDLPHWCASIEKVLSDEKESGEIFCVWGSFRINREELTQGVRFTFPRCSNALQWTVTRGPQSNLIIHLTINRIEHDPDYVDSIKQFMEDWKAGLEAHW